MKRPIRTVIFLLLAAIGFGCAQDSIGPKQTSPVVSLVLSVSPVNVTLPAGNEIALKALVKNWKLDSTVSWNVIGEPSGVLTATGASATFMSWHREDTTVVTVRVTSNEDSTKRADCLIIVAGIRQSVRLWISPLRTTLTLGANQQFSSTVVGSQNPAVRWRLISGPGTLMTNGLYQAPSSIASQSDSAKIEAMLLADTTVRSYATVDIQQPADPEPCFRTVIQPIFVSHCGKSGCHNPIDRLFEFELTTHEGLMKGIVPGDTAKSILWYRANHVSKLSQEKLQNIARWILTGAKNTQCENNTIDTSDVRYSNFISPFFENTCRGCHSGRFAYQSGGLDFTTYDVIREVALDGRLLGTIEPNPERVHMPMYGNQLDEPTLAKIRCWINRGAPND